MPYRYRTRGKVQFKPRTFRRRTYINKRKRFAYPKSKTRIEHKFHEVVRNDSQIAIGGAITDSLVLIAQGLTESTRVGRGVHGTRLNCKFIISLPVQNDSAQIGDGDIVRIITYIDKQPNGANAAVLDILETATFLSFRNLNNTKRFKFLRDKKYTLNRMVSMTDGTNTSNQPATTLYIEENYKLNLDIDYSAGTGAVTELTEANIAHLYISQNGFPGIVNINRFRFTD